MLSELNVVGKWFQDEPAEGWHFDEISFDDEAKNVFEMLPLNITVFEHAAKVDIPKNENHCYIPGHYFLYALKLWPLVSLLGKYMNSFEGVVNTFNTDTSAVDFYNTISSHISNNAVLDKLDPYSRDNFVKVFRSDTDRLGAKNILNKDNKKGKKFRPKDDFVRSILLKAIPVPDASSEMLGKLIYAFSESPEAYDYLISHYSAQVPYLLLSAKGDDFLFMLLSILGWEGKLDELYSQATGRTCDWGNIPDAFLLSPTPVAGNASYLDKPIYYSAAQKKYVHIKKGLMDAQSQLGQVSGLMSALWPDTVIENNDDKFYLRSSSRKAANGPRLEGGRNKIVYGAPGTGKSHSILEETKKEYARKVVTVFHPDTQYSDFVGSLKPQTERGENAKPIITYKYRPGPFTRSLIEAENNPSDKVFLVIEEINRAPAAAVFGEIFQLLDRSSCGASTYGIEAADPDMLEYVSSETGIDVTELKLPSNLFIYATMNSSDQAVMPLDTAFKRRWSFEYIKIDFNNTAVPQQTLQLLTSDGLYNISWKDFANKVINEVLKEFRVAEDRLIGPFFLDETELKDWDTARSSLCGKLFVYLWDDVLRHKLLDRKRLFDEKITTYGDLFDRFMQDNPTESIFAIEADTLIRGHGVKIESTDA